MERKRILSQIRLDRIAAVTEPAQEGALAAIMKSARPYTDAQRAEMADRGVAMPDGRYLIADKRDLLASLASEPSPAPDVKAHIVGRAQALGLADDLPTDWTVPEEENDDMGDDFTAKARGIMKRDGCTRTQALSRAADEFPALLAKHRQDVTPEAPEPDANAAAIEKARRSFHDEVRAVAKAQGVPNWQAMSAVSRDRPDLYQAAFG